MSSKWGAVRAHLLLVSEGRAPRAEPLYPPGTEARPTIPEKKRDKLKLTNRQVWLRPVLKDALADWVKKRGKGKLLLCKMDGNQLGHVTSGTSHPSSW